MSRNDPFVVFEERFRELVAELPRDNLDKWKSAYRRVILHMGVNILDAFSTKYTEPMPLQPCAPMEYFFMGQRPPPYTAAGQRPPPYISGQRPPPYIAIVLVVDSSDPPPKKPR